MELWNALRFFNFRIGAPFDPDAVLDCLHTPMVIDGLAVADDDAHSCFEMVVKEIVTLGKKGPFHAVAINIA